MSIFQRYNDGEISDTIIQMPQQMLTRSTHQFPIDVLASHLKSTWQIRRLPTKIILGLRGL